MAAKPNLLIILFLSVVPICMIEGLMFDSENLVNLFVSEYKRYRQLFGCNVILCSPPDKTEHEPTRDDQVPETPLGRIEQEMDQNNLTFITFTITSNQNCCSNCSCDENCEQEGMCCPDKLPHFPDGGSYPLGGIYGCHMTSVKPKPELSQKYRKMVTKCDLRYKNVHTIRKCESMDPQMLDEFITVSHNRTKEAYKNIFCARCNFVVEEDILTWQSKLLCYEGMIPPLGRSYILQQLRDSSTCNIVFDPPTGYKPATCKEPISRCNVSGEWAKADSFIETACSAYTAELKSHGQTYKNVFCFICNNAEFTFPSRCSINKLEIGITPSVSFSVLLDFRPPVLQAKTSMKKTDSCFETEVLDPYKGICRPIICPDMTELYEGTCQRIVHSTPGLCFEAHIRVTFSMDVYGSGIDIFIHSYFKKVFKQLKGLVTFHMYYEELRFDSRKQTILSKDNVVISVIFTDADFIDTLVGLHGTAVLIDIISKNETASIELFDEQKRIDEICSGKMIRRYVINSHPKPRIDCLSKSIAVSKFLSCAMIQINTTEYSVTENKSGIYLQDLDIFMSNDEFMRIQPTLIQICIDSYINQTTNETKHLNPAIKDDTLTVSLIALICLICSVVSLIVTIAAYLSLHTLQTQPGINNLFLSFSLLLAYISLLVGAFPSVQGMFCKIIGLCIHFFWLNSTFWMNACSFHMFKRFGSIQATTRRNMTRTYIGYCVSSSTVFVCINIIWSLIRSNSLSVGYGKVSNVCYIIYSDMIGYTLTAPVCVAVSVNMVMYMLVIYRVTRMPVVPNSTAQDRQYFMIYVKLSTITGITWLTFIPARLTKNVIVESIFTILVASQGIFIMFAFICNRRVLKLVIEKVNGKRINRSRTSTDTSSNRTTMSKVECPMDEITARRRETNTENAL